MTEAEIRPEVARRTCHLCADPKGTGVQPAVDGIHIGNTIGAPHKCTANHALADWVAELVQRVREQERTELGWLIEISNAGPIYWSGMSALDFTPLASQACRFARKQDAQKVLHGVVPTNIRERCSVIQHGWSE